MIYTIGTILVAAGGLLLWRIARALRRDERPRIERHPRYITSQGRKMVPPRHHNGKRGF